MIEINRDLVNKLRAAAAWCEADSGETLPINRNYAVSTFTEAAEAIDLLRQEVLTAVSNYEVALAAKDELIAKLEADLIYHLRQRGLYHERIREDNPMDAEPGQLPTTAITPEQANAADMQSSRPGREE